MLSNSKVAKDPVERLKVMIVCGEHGREMVTSELCYYFTALLGGQERQEFPDMLPLPPDARESLEKADEPKPQPPPPLLTTTLCAQISRAVEFRIVPVTNQESRKRVEYGAICDRNPRGTVFIKY